jgi:hypothetical protein
MRRRLLAIEASPHGARQSTVERHAEEPRLCRHRALLTVQGFAAPSHTAIGGASRSTSLSRRQGGQFMHEHRGEYDRRLTGTVRGAGVSDVLIVDLQPAQIPWLVDELETLRGPLEEEWHRVSANAAASKHGDAACERDERLYELKLVRMMRAGLPATGHDAPVTFAGPTVLVCELVHGAMHNAAATLAELTHGSRAEPREHERLEAVANAAAAWVQTFLDLRAVVWFNFDPDADPLATS